MSDSEMAIIIQPHPEALFWEVSFSARIEGGKLANLQGLGGITQPEDAVGLLHRDDRSFRWQSFLWSHYTAACLHIDGSQDSVLVIDGGGKRSEIRIADIGTVPMAVPTGDNGAILIAKYMPLTEGSLTVAPDTVLAGETAKFVVEFTVGDSGIDEDGGIRVNTPYSSWSFPELFDGAVTLQSTGTATLETSLAPYFHPMSVFGYSYHMKVKGGRLSKGDVIRIQYSKADTGITVQAYPKERAHFPAFIDARATGIYYPFSCSDVAAVRVQAGAPDRLRLAVPMVVRRGEVIDARALVLDAHYNPVFGEFSGSLTLRITAMDGSVRHTSAESIGGRAVFDGIRLEDEGLYIFTAESEGLASANLVVKCVGSDAGTSLYWGSIHGHTGMSDGEGDTAEYYPYGRDIGMLDFCALADHEWELIEHERSRNLGGFRYVQELAAEFNDPGRFVTISGYEWMGAEGHVNVYYNNDALDNPICLGNISVVERTEAPALAQLVDRYRNRADVMLIPHTSHGFQWTAYDPDLMPAVEMYSCWGCSEHSVRPGTEGANEALQRGYHLGFIGGADSHHSNPGHTCKPSKYHVLGWREGFAAVYASELSRDGIFDAIRRKHCYATTAERILLEFSANGTPMGGSVRLAAGTPLRFEATVGGTAPISKIDLVRNGDVVHSVDGSSLVERYEHEYVSADEGYYYIRVTQADGERAWSSPIWICCD